MKMKRKAMGLSPDFIIIFFLALTVGVVGFVMIFKYPAQAMITLDDEKIRQQHGLCELKMKQAIERGEDIDDPEWQELNEPIESKKGKADGFPDECDLCLGGDDNIAVDGIPRDCYSDPTAEGVKTYKQMCRNVGDACYISDTGQCCLFINVDRKDCPKSRCR